MLARCTTYVLSGITAHRVLVEADVRPGLPSFTLIGLGDSAAREVRETVRAAVQNCGHRFPDGRLTVNIAPARLRSASASIPLAVAVAVLAAAGEIPAQQLADTAVYGHLTPGGDIAPLPGTLAAVEAHRRNNRNATLLYGGPALAAGLAPPRSRALANLPQIGGAWPRDDAPGSPPRPSSTRWAADFCDVRGHDEAIYALTVAAAGGHHVLLRGAPEGSGATMLARRLPTILPELTRDQQREVAIIRDAAGIDPSPAIPFRAPHHTISAAGLVGGGSPVRPGEITLAHRGVLLLSALPEFARGSLEALRMPLDAGEVVIVRGTQAYRLPARFQLVATASPCPCANVESGSCVCDPQTLRSHRRRLSASLLDRFAIVVDLPATVPPEPLPPAPCSEELRGRVVAARERRAHRNAASADAPPSSPRRQVDVAPRLTQDAEAALEDAYCAGHVSRRGSDQVLAVAATVADLAGEESVTAQAISAALALRGGRPVHGLTRAG